MIALIEPYISEISEIEFLAVVTSVIGFAIAIILIADSVFVFQKISHSQIMESLLKEDEHRDDDDDDDDDEKETK